MGARLLVRLTAPQLLVSAMLLLAGGLAAGYLHRLQIETSTTLDVKLDSVRAAEQFDLGIRDVRHWLCLYLLEQQPDYLRSAMQKLRELLPALEQMESSERTLGRSKELQEIRRGYEQVNSRLERLLSERQEIGELRSAVQALVQEGLTLGIGLPADQHVEVLVDEVRKISKINTRIANRMAFVLLAMGLCSAVAGLLTGFGLARTVSRSMFQLSVPIHDAAGKLNEVVGPITLQTAGGFEELQTSLRQLAERVGAVVGRYQESQQQILRSEQLIALGQLAAGLAHELRNPLMAMKLLVQSGRETGGASLDERDLAVFEEEITRLERLLQSFLDYARPANPRRDLFDLSLVLRQKLRLISARAEQQGVRLIADFPETSLMLQADQGQLRQVILNLLLNALDALPGGGTIWLRAVQEARGVTVEVADDGPGFAPGVQDRIFEPFFSTKETGTGMGLAISKQIVEAHRGSLTVENRPQGGALFRCFLPSV